VSYRLELSLAKLPDLQAAGQVPKHWAVRNREKVWWRNQIAWWVVSKGKPEKPLQRASVTLTRCSTQEPDTGNLAASFKAIEDALVHAGVLEDDCPRVCRPVYAWERAKRGQGGVRIVVESTEEA
jgi:Holliday junction resolvase RusA-like endonuclease